MGTKKDPGEFDCYEAARDDEPMFVLLARDPEAANLVETWAVAREMRLGAKMTEADRRKVADARKCAKAMRRWHEKNRRMKEGKT